MTAIEVELDIGDHGGIKLELVVDHFSHEISSKICRVKGDELVDYGS